MISCPTGKRWTRPRYTIDRCLRVGGVGNYNSRRTGDGGRRRRHCRANKGRRPSGAVLETEKKYEPRNTRNQRPGGRRRTLTEHVAALKTRRHRKHTEICFSCSRCCSLPIIQAGLWGRLQFFAIIRVS